MHFEKTIKIMTFNVQAGRRLKRIIWWLGTIPPQDILCFQEFPKEKISQMRKIFSHRTHGYRFAPSLVKRKRLYGVLTIFRKEECEYISSSILSLGGSKFERRVFRNTAPRSCLITVFRLGKKRFIVANAHLVAFAINKYKYLQAEAVVRTLAKKRSPIVMLGDFNISSIIGKRKLIALMHAHGYETQKKRLPTHRIAVVKHQFDYVFAKECHIDNLSVAKVRFSDHYPVFAGCTI